MDLIKPIIQKKISFGPDIINQYILFASLKNNNLSYNDIINKFGYNLEFKIKDDNNIKSILNIINQTDIKDLIIYNNKSTILNKMIMNFIIKLIDNQYDIVIFPLMNSGEYMLSYINSYNYKKIYGYDDNYMDVNLSKLNYYLTTGNIPDNICYKNILYDDINNGDLIIADLTNRNINNIEYEKCCEKIKSTKMNYELLCIHLFSKSLNINGKCILIVSRNFIINHGQSFYETRQYLLSNFNVTDIISLKNNKYIIIFINSRKRTKNVQFSEIVLNNNFLEKQNILLVNYIDIALNEYLLYIDDYKHSKLNYNIIFKDRDITVIEIDGKIHYIY